MAGDLPVGYYRDNFEFLLDFVHDRYADLLNPAELAYRNQWQGLSLPAQRLYVRLALRKGPLFRRDKLAYPEIPDIDAAAAELTQAGYLDNGATANHETLLGLLRVPELARLRPGDDQLSRVPGRAALVADLLCTTTATETFAAIPFDIYQPQGLSLLRVFRLLFFGNLHQDFTEFVLNDLGIMPYERYPLDQASRLFDHRDLIDQALSIAALQDQVQLSLEANDVAALMDYPQQLPSAVASALQSRLDRITNRVARQLERLDQGLLAQHLYAGCTTGIARQRRARLLAVDHADAALSLCQAIITAPEDEAEYEFALGFAARLVKQRKLTPVPPLPCASSFVPPTRQLCLPYERDQRVELAVVHALHEAGDQAFYVENGLFTALFGLAFWDIIYAPVPGAFFHPFQRGPADLYDVSFREARAAMIQQRFSELTCIAALETRVMRVAAEKVGITNPFVNWSVLTPTLLQACFGHIPIDHMLVVFRRLLADPRANRSGFPDLVVFPAAGSYLLAEVKGPNDSLQANQLRWLRYFAAAQMPVEVINVTWQ